MFDFPILNLPAIQLQLNTENNKPYYFDEIRKKWLVLTPEEWVRQHIISYLINHKKYPKGLINAENNWRINDRNKRTDVIVYHRNGDVFMLIECKKSSVKLNQSVFDQLANYNTLNKANYLLITNGLQHLCCKMNYETKSYEFVSEIPDFPIN